MHLILNYRDANECGIHGHAQTIFRELGINYELAMPQSIADQFWFFNCTNIPEPLPIFLKVLDVKVKDCKYLNEEEKERLAKNEA
ncbi:MAG: hypothetical protein WC374_05865 [Phycisphaerae bacterium]